MKARSRPQGAAPESSAPTTSTRLQASPDNRRVVQRARRVLARAIADPSYLTDELVAAAELVLDAGRRS